MAARIKPSARLRDRRFDELDLALLVEELKDLGEALERSVRSRARTIMEHLLKLQRSPAQDPRLGWRATVRTQRNELLNDVTPSLRCYLADYMAEVYGRARHDAEGSPRRARRRRRAAPDLPLQARSDHRRLAAVNRSFPGR